MLGRGLLCQRHKQAPKLLTPKLLKGFAQCSPGY